MSIEASVSVLGDSNRTAAPERRWMDPTAGTESPWARLAARFLQAPAALVLADDGGAPRVEVAYGLPRPIAGERTGPCLRELWEALRGRRVPIAEELQPPLELGGFVAHSIAAVPALDAEGRLIGAGMVLDQGGRRWSEGELETLGDLAALLLAPLRQAADLADLRAAGERLADESRIVETLNRTGRALAAELDLHTLVQAVTDAATELSGARFGAFFYNALNEQGEVYTLYTISGVPREAFSRFPMPRNTAVFEPTFRGDGVVRSDDIRADPRYGRNPPYHGMPEGHLPVRSYLAVPVISRTGEVHGGLFFGHPEPGVFTESSERLVVGIAAQAAIAIDNARLYQKSVEAERRFREMMDGLEAIFWEADARTFQFTFVSRRAEDLLGYPLERWRESGFWAGILHPEDRHWAPEYCLGETREGRDHTFEYRAVAADGRVIWLRDIVYVMKDAEGRVVGLRGVMVDISERKDEERRQAVQLAVTRVLAEAATLSEALPRILGAIAESTGWAYGGFWEADPSAGGLRCVETWTAGDASFPRFEAESRSSHFRPGEGLPGRCGASGRALWVEDVGRHTEFPRLATAAGEGLRGGCAVPIRLGEEMLGVMEFFSRETRAEDPRLVELLESLGSHLGQFIERKRAEESLRENARLTALRAETSLALAGSEPEPKVLQRCCQMIVDHLDVAFARIWTVNGSGDVLELQASAGLYTHTDGPHGRVPVGRFKIGKIAEERTPHLTNDVLNDPRVSNPEWARREGMVAFAGYPLLLGERLVGVLAMFSRQPISDAVLSELVPVADGIAQYLVRKRAEEALRVLNAELEARVEERTLQLREANRELESFSYSVSHDLRAPLRHIGGYAKLLQKQVGSSLDETSRRYLQTILDSVSHAGSLVDDLLAFSRMGRAEMRQRRVDTSVLVREVIAEMQGETAGRKLAWEVGALPQVAADAAMLRLVFRNLLENAAKYTRPREEARVTVSAEVGEREVVFSVRDNGVGFEMRHADKLFGVFQRLHSAEEFEGTGIGLANVRRIVMRHGGRVWAEGEAGRGAAFFFTLPRCPGEEGA